MRTLILSDIHANLAALEAVLEHVRGQAPYDRVICLGDIVGYGPDPNEVIDRVRRLDPAAAIRGNHDKACCGITNAEDFNAVARFAANWTRGVLRAENLSYLRQLDVGPLALDDFQIVHGSIRDEDEYVFTPRDAGENLAMTEQALTFCGHTHFQGGFARQSEDKVSAIRVNTGSGAAGAELLLDEGVQYLINPGSIGQPRDGDSRAAYAFYDGGKRLVEYYRVPYDVEATQKKMKELELPDPLIARLAVGR